MAASRRWIDVDEALNRVPARPRLGDALDALAAAWSARRWLAGEAVVLPVGEVPVDDLRRPMRIVRLRAPRSSDGAHCLTRAQTVSNWGPSVLVRLSSWKYGQPASSRAPSNTFPASSPLGTRLNTGPK